MSQHAQAGSGLPTTMSLYSFLLQNFLKLKFEHITDSFNYSEEVQVQRENIFHLYK